MPQKTQVVAYSLPTEERAYVKAFKQGFLEHLSRPYDEREEKNQPGSVLADSLKSPGNLSRIFDAFTSAVFMPDGDDINQTIERHIEEAGGYRQYMQAILDAITPTLLNHEKNGLSPKVISAIGGERYEALLSAASEEASRERISPEKAIATQFTRAVGLSFPQRVLDRQTTPTERLETNANLGGVVTPMFNYSTVTRLPRICGEELTLAELEARINDCREQLKLFGDDEKKRMQSHIHKVDFLLGEREAFEGELSYRTKQNLVLTEYNKLVNLMLPNMLSPDMSEPEEPKPRSSFIQKLREISGDKTLRQNDEERKFSRYNKLKDDLARYVDKAATTPENQVLQAKVVLRKDIAEIGKHRVKIGGVDDSVMDAFIVDATTQMKEVKNMNEARALKKRLSTTLDTLKAGKKAEQVIKKLLSKPKPGMQATRVTVGEAMARQPLNQRGKVSTEVKTELNRHRVSSRLSRHSDTKTFRNFKKEMEKIATPKEPEVKKNEQRAQKPT
ncbi:MAG: hypothetical protein K0U24_03430 [Gammaproteobacteria bacterium]|nr:hypothetical protein [Gammaproteobacteria bacterium]